MQKKMDWIALNYAGSVRTQNCYQYNDILLINSTSKDIKILQKRQMLLFLQNILILLNQTCPKYARVVCPINSKRLQLNH